MKTLYLHVGTHKTGTSSIQKWLDDQCATLLEFGILVPRTGRHMASGHLNLAWELSGDPRFSEVNGTKIDLFSELSSVSHDVVILSSEDFGCVSNRTEVLSSFIEEFRKRNYQIKIVVYLRNPLDYAASLYSEYKKYLNNFDPNGTNASLEALRHKIIPKKFISEIVGSRSFFMEDPLPCFSDFDYRRLVENYERAVSDEDEVWVRSYCDDVVRDFSNLIGLACQIKSKTIRENRSELSQTELDELKASFIDQWPDAVDDWKQLLLEREKHINSPLEAVTKALSPSLGFIPDRLTDITSWHGHVPFVPVILHAIKPHVFVELGVHKGDSYSAFCQVIRCLDMDTKCYGVDTWGGDHQAGFYGDQIYGELKNHHDSRYLKFSTLLRMTFDEALEKFENNSIDLLHIDGLHTYEAVKHDFVSWLPKLSSKGAVLFHDTVVRHDDFGVWKLWDELEGKYSTFQFYHSHGLGILQVGERGVNSFEFVCAEDNRMAVAIRSVAYQQSLLMKGAEAEKARNEAEELGGKLAEIYASRSWRFTAPLRKSMSALRQVRRSRWLKPDPEKRSLSYRIARKIYRITPIPFDIKIKIRHFVKKILLQSDDANAIQSCNMYSVEGASYVPRIRDRGENLNACVRVIAIYLPQFHPITENDEWWGEGFTEWTNVCPAKPLFDGHYQPHEPDEYLGYYDLRDASVLSKQIKLAKEYGIEGFCFYYYWFSGKRLLETPLEIIFGNKKLDINYCICWANENWTRAWDGLDKEVLISQRHSPEDDIAFIADAARYLFDPRYIRINDRPLLIIYRPDLFPDFKESANRWRKWCRDNGVGEIFIAYVQSFEKSHPSKYGIDAAIEFPPAISSSPDLSKNYINDRFKGRVFDWRIFVHRSYNYEKPDYLLFRGLNPGWDNTPRKKERGTVYANYSPKLFYRWAVNAFLDTVDRISNKDERLVFVNAWNEWAEGAHLEPDKKFGYGNLQAIYDALSACLNERRKIIYVGHDAHFHGAQILSLHIIRMLKEHFSLDVHIMLLKSGGVLEKEYEANATVYYLDRDYPTRAQQRALIDKLQAKGACHAIGNTVVSGDIIGLLAEAGIETVALIHELPELIKSYKMEENARIIAQKAKYVVFPSLFVREKFETIASVSKEKVVLSPQGLYHTNRYKDNIAEARTQLRKELDLPHNSKIVLGVGYADHRKGIDLFVEVAAMVEKSVGDVYFVWVGSIDAQMRSEVARLAKRCSHLRLVPTREEIELFYAGADLYLMTSREDPFPSVILEAMNVAVPVIGFRDAGGFQDIVTEKTGRLVSYLDTPAMAEAVGALLRDDAGRHRLGRNGAELIGEKFRFMDYIYRLLELAGMPFKKVSVVIPNYNYAQYIQERLQSVLDQSYPIYETILLDDCSTDNSLNVARSFLQSCDNAEVTIVENERNSGSVFRQWAKGISMVKGDYVWIAEADDLAELTFLEKAMEGFGDPKVVLSYTQSKQMAENGTILDKSYLGYTDDINTQKWRYAYMRDGMEELADTLVVKNTIPNVSAVVFKKVDISEILPKLLSFKVAGDWYFYVWLLKQGKIAFCPQSLNMHRRHTTSVTSSLDAERHYDEVLRMQEMIKAGTNVDRETDRLIGAYRVHLRNYLGIRQIPI